MSDGVIFPRPTNPGAITTPRGAPPPEALNPASVGTRLITSAGDQVARYTGNRESDVRTALLRGLAEYVSQLSVDIQGRTVSFVSVFDTYPDSEQSALYPSAIINGSSEGSYDASKFQPAIISSSLVQLKPGSFLSTWAEFSMDMAIEVWANDTRDRSYLIAMLEDALNPVDWMYGCVLELPHYFNERAQYELLRVAYMDNDDNVIKRFRRAQMTVHGTVAANRILQFPIATRIIPEETVT